MGIAEKYGIEVWRWRGGQWVARHHDGSEDKRTGAQMGISGKQPDDWLIDRRRAGRGTYIPADDMFATGTLWHFDGSDWHPIYRRTSGLERPAYLDEMKEEAKTGDVLVEAGQSDELTVYDSNGERYTMSAQIAAVLDDRYDQPPSAADEPEDPREARIDDAALKVAASVDKIISIRRNLAQISSDWAGYKPGDRVTVKMAMVLKKALEEANPSATPGTTAINDYVSLANDIETGKIGGDFQAHGIDSKGSSVSGSDAIANIAYCKLASDALAGCGAVLDGALQLRAMIKSENLAPGTQTGARQQRGELNTALASYELDVVKGVSYLFTATDKVIKLADASSSAAQATGTVATVAIAPATTVVGMLTFARHVRKAHRARLRWSVYKQMLKDDKIAPYHPDIQACMRFLVGKSGRRLRTQAATASTALISSAAGTMLTVTAIVGGANAWNPVGWTLLGVAAVGGVGIVGYKLYKRWTREKRHARRLQKYGGIKSGDSAARKLIDIYRGKLEKRDRQAAGTILESFGVDLRDLNSHSGHEAAVALVIRHLEK